MISFIALCFLLILVVKGDPGRLYINEPNSGNSWNPGSNVAIRWIPISETAFPPSLLSIDIMDGDAQNPNLVAHIADGVPSGVSVYNWVVPANMAQRPDYFIRISSFDLTGASYFYSGRYAIGGDVMAATIVTQPWSTLLPSESKPTVSHSKKPKPSITSPIAIITEHISSTSSIYTELASSTTSSVLSTFATTTTETTETTTMTSLPTSTMSSNTISSFSNTATETSSEVENFDASSNIPIISAFGLIAAGSFVLFVSLGLVI